MSTCRACAADNPPQARFCNQCGSRLAEEAVGYTPRHLVERVLRDRAALLGERKRVTVLFADIRGSTRLAEQVGAEAWHAILDRFFGLLAGAVHRYEGTVNQYTGDGIMALFGAPVAHEDHAVRACLAALEMQEQIRRYAQELQRSRGIELALRIGLNSGEVIVGRIGDDLRMDYTAQGLTVNLAARMEQICEPGAVYLTRDTARLVQAQFELRPLGEQAVHGLNEPLPVFALAARKADDARDAHGLARSASPLLGREPELRRLQQAMQQAQAGRGQVVAISAAAGLGKTRLSQEFARRCADAGLRVHRTAGSPYAASASMAPAQQLLRSRLGLGADAAPEEVRRRVEQLLQRDPQLLGPGVSAFVLDFLGVAAPGELVPEQAASLRAPMMQRLVQTLARSRRPQLLLIEDVHYFDAGDAAFLRELLPQVAASSSLLLLTLRSGHELPAPLPPGALALTLQPLDADECLQLARRRLGPAPELDDIAAELARRAGGNPFFVEEAVQVLEDTGHLAGEPGAYGLARTLGEWPIADSVHALIAARVDRLPLPHKALLQAAAVVGQEFSRAQLQALLPWRDAERQVDAQLQALQDGGFIEPRPAAAQYRFCQPLLQEVTYRSLLESQRQAAHAAVARALEGGGRPDGAPQEAARRIALHWQRAGDPLQAGCWLLNAARWFAARDTAAALAGYREARQLLDGAPDSAAARAARVAACAGLIRMAQFVPVAADEVEQAYAQARRLIAADGGAPATAAALAELLISYSNEWLHRGDAVRAAQLAEEAVALCRSAGLPELVNRFRLAILLSHYVSGRAGDGIALVDGAAGPGWRTRPVDSDNCMSRAMHAMYLAWTGQIARAQHDLLAAVDVMSREDRSASWMYCNLVDLAWLGGDAGRVLEHARAALQRADAFGSLYFRALALRALGLALCLAGRHAEALPHLEEARPLTAAGGLAHVFEAYLLAVQSEALLGVGRLDQAAARAAEALDSARRSGAVLWEMRAWTARLALPRQVLGDGERSAGIARLRALVERTGSVALLPRLRGFEAATAAGRTG